MTNENIQNELRHDNILGGIQSYGFQAGARRSLGEASKPEFLHMARPKRRARSTISLELDCDLESEAGRGLGTFKRVPWGLANISAEIMSG